MVRKEITYQQALYLQRNIEARWFNHVVVGNYQVLHILSVCL